MFSVSVSLCIFCGLAASASPDRAPGHLSLVQHSARNAKPLRGTIATSHSQDYGIQDVMAKMKEAWVALDRSLTGEEKINASFLEREARGENETMQSVRNASGFTTDAIENITEIDVGSIHQRAAERCSLLVFVPIGSFEQGGHLLKGNLEHLHLTLKGHCGVSVFLNHYEGHAAEEYWITQANKWEEGWYKRHIKYSTSMPGIKFQVMQKLLRGVDMESFTWVWALDEDFNILNTDVKRVLERMKQSGALISVPAFTQTGDNEEERELSFPMQGQSTYCLYRYADVVEGSFPLFQAKALEAILWDCDQCIGERTVWGLDRIWCSYTARKLGHDRSTACAIIDDAPMAHQNSKALKHKYDDSGDTLEARPARRMDEDLAAEASALMADVEKRFPEDFVAGNIRFMNSTKCVKK